MGLREKLYRAQQMSLIYGKLKERGKGQKLVNESICRFEAANEGRYGGPAKHFFPSLKRICTLLNAGPCFLEGKTERERELAWAKYFHKKEESVGRKNGKEQQQQCIVWGCWRASVDRRHWGPSANIIHCHAGALIYLYFFFYFSLLLLLPLLPYCSCPSSLYGQRSF